MASATAARGSSSKEVAPPSRGGDGAPEDPVRAQFEQVIKYSMQPRLDRALQLRASLLASKAQYSQLGEQLSLLQSNSLESVETLVNMGSQFFVTARIPDTSTVMVDLGLGYHLEMSLTEATAFAAAKVKELTIRIDALSKEVAEVKGHIALTRHTLSQLDQLNAAS